MKEQFCQSSVAFRRLSNKRIDDNISYCYSERFGAPVLYEDGRSRTDYRRAWLSAVQNDLVTQLPFWKEIAAMAPGPKITPLRALDIIGWELGNRRN